MATKLRDQPLPTYDGDAAGWAEAQAAALRERRADMLDWDNLAIEIADVSGRERDKIESALVLVMMHLLKWDYQPERRSLSWVLTIREQRRRVARGLRENPSLRPRVTDMIDASFPSALVDASNETGIVPRLLPAVCPFDFDAIMTRSVEWDGERA